MQKLVDLKVVSTPEITFFILPFDVLLSNYITTIENFIYEDSDSINTKIATVVTKRLSNTPNITALIHNHLAIPDPEAHTKAYNSIYVIFLCVEQSSPCTVWNMYFCNPPLLTLKPIWMSVTKSVNSVFQQKTTVKV